MTSIYREWIHSVIFDIFQILDITCLFSYPFLQLAWLRSSHELFCSLWFDLTRSPTHNLAKNDVLCIYLYQYLTIWHLKPNQIWNMTRYVHDNLNYFFSVESMSFHRGENSNAPLNPNIFEHEVARKCLIPMG
jgi:hypothetical protein